ncbi:cytochrome P450 6B5 [Manduca sexta]|uniref:unspecific monooxygenase n=1 Tax=Manduca sexta TaxID=7130 RepID=A0A921ZL66_MANSE|nr:cytochrome P450 6B5 [Manduca sexta]KAG6459204.1 hypothetical protein O3G_MSEX011272 [Manduca sexta]
MFNILVIVFGVLFVVYYLTTRKFNYWKKRNVPHLPPVPLFGNYSSMILQRKTFGEVVSDICEKFPKAPVVGAYFGTEPVLIPRDPEVIKTILTKDFYYFNGREVSEYAHRDGDLFTLFATYGDHWKVLRQNLTPLFSSAKMKNMFKMITQNAYAFEKLLEQDTKQEVLDVKNVMERFTIECIGSCVFGVATNTIEKDEANPFKKAGNDILKPNKMLAFKGVMRAIWPSIFYGLRIPLFTNELNLFRQVLIAVFKERETNPTKTQDFINLIMKWKQQSYIEGDKLRPAHSAENGKTSVDVTDELVRAQCVVFFAAGFETSAVTLTHTLYELSKNERVMQKACEEVDAFMKRYNNHMTYESLSELQYLDACLDEALRKYPVLGCITREVMHDYILSPGIHIEKGMRVHIPVQYLQNNANLFPEPEEYRPERFIGEEKRNIIPYSYMPFGEGPRICIGMRFAKMQMLAGLVTVLKSYKVTLGDNVPKKLRFLPESFVTVSADRIKLKFTRRNGWEKALYAQHS